MLPSRRLVAGHASSPERDAHVAVLEGNLEGGAGDVVGLGRRAAHHAADAMQEERDARLNFFDKLEGAAQLLCCALDARELGRAKRDELHGVRERMELGARGQVRRRRGAEELGQVLAGCLDHLLGHREGDRGVAVGD